MKKLLLLLVFLVGCQSIDCTTDPVPSNCLQYMEECSEYDPQYGIEYCKQLEKRSLETIVKESETGKECDGLSTYRDLCYTEIAEKIQDYKICDKIKDETTNQRCLSEVKPILKDISISDLPEINKITKKIEYSLYPETKHVIKSVSIGRGTLRTDDFEFASLNPTECNKVRNEEDPPTRNMYALCIQKIAQLTGNQNHCKLLSNEEYAPYQLNNCAKSFALATGDAKSCFLINKDVIKDTTFTNCVSNTIYANPSKEGCELLGNTIGDRNELKDSCYSRI